MNFSTYCLSVLEFEVVFLFSCVCACVCPSACLHSNVPKDMFYILYCCRDNSDNIYHHQLMWKTKSAPCGKNQTLVSVHITSKDSKGLLSSCFFFFIQNSFIRRPICSQICKQLSSNKFPKMNSISKQLRTVAYMLLLLSSPSQWYS